MVRELEQQRSRRLAIVIDTLTDVGDAGTPLDACCTAAASIGRVAFTEGHRVRFVVSGPGVTVEVSDDVDDGSFRRRLAAVVPDGVALADVLDRGADAFRDIDAVVMIFPTWRSNGDAPLGRAIGTLAATRTHVVAMPVEVGPNDAKRVAALRADEIDGFIGMLDGAGAETHLWRYGMDLVDVLAPERSVERTVVG